MTALRRFTRWTIAVSSALLLAGCVSLGGGKPPEFLLTLTPDATVAGGQVKSGAMESGLVVDLPVASKEVDQLRIPVRMSDSQVAYLTEAYWIEKPTRLFQSLVAETVAAKTGRLVLDGRIAGNQTAQRLEGELRQFGVDAAAMEVVIVYDAVLLKDGAPLQKRRFEVRRNVGAIEAGPVGAALNTAANMLAGQVADWVGPG